MNICSKLMRKLPFAVILLAVACNAQLRATYTPTPKITETVIPSAKPFPTSASKSTVVPYPTLTFDLQDQLYSLLKTNGNCELPCFLGITPGQTSWLNAKSQLERFSETGPIQPDNVASMPILTVYYAQIQTNRDIELMLRIRLEVDTRAMVQHIIFDASIYRNGQLVTDDHHLSAYSLRSVFQRYGRPDAIYILPPKDGVYSLQAVYEKLKIVINLTGLAQQNTTGKYLLCPNLGDGDISTMQFALASSWDPVDVKTLIGYPFYESEFPLEKATGLSLEYFYRLVIGDQQPACFQVQ